MKIRTSVEADLDQILGLTAEKSVNTADSKRYTEFLASRQYRPEFTWVAEDGDRLVAVAIWWTFPEGDRPIALDGLFADASITDPVPLWTDMVRPVVESVPAEEEQASYHIFLPAGWRDDAAILAALRPRVAAAKAAGLTEELERLRFEWVAAEMAVPARSSRLSMRPGEDGEFLDVFKRVAQGSLDASTHEAIARVGLDGYAHEDLELYKSMPGERSWWRLAYDADGDLVGFAMPSANNGGPVVGFLGVVPEHRGHGYSHDLLAEITADLAGMGAQRITADTDMGNKPMAATFGRVGYRTFAVRLVLSPAPR